jgi:hypothetical protein
LTTHFFREAWFAGRAKLLAKVRRTTKGTTKQRRNVSWMAE